MKEQKSSKRISIKKDHIDFFGQKLYPPFYLEDVRKVLGDGRTIPAHDEIKKSFYVWDELGIQAWMNDEITEAEAFGICIAEYKSNLPKKLYDGAIYIGTKDYRETKWKFDLEFAQEKKLGCFEIATLLPSELSKVDNQFKDIALQMSSMIEVDYTPIENKKKEKKYVLNPIHEPALTFTHFNFKLAVIQLLMYKKELLKPKFDIYEFAEEYAKRKIDIEDEGYEPIQEALNWFKKLEIPERLADEVDDLVMDGGNDIYHQIIPFWDGEDDYFDINALDEAEVKQFKNLHHITLMSANPDKAIETLETCNVTVELL